MVGVKVIVAGGTGFIGRALVRALLNAGHEIVLLTRRPLEAAQQASGTVQIQLWDAHRPGPWESQLEGADAIINLAGEPIAAKRWTKAQKAKIVSSRVQLTELLVRAIAKAQLRPRILINASAVGYYGPVAAGTVTEEHPSGHDFLAETCVRWEAAAWKAEEFGLRAVCLRTGVVLGEEGGALAKMLPPFQLFMGGPLGSGRQPFPWIHRDDVVGIILFALEHQTVSGPVNVTAPQVVTMKEFCQGLGKILKRPSWLPVPAWVLRLSLGELAAMLLTGQRAVPQKIQAAGYSFQYPKLETALRAIFAP